MKQNVVGYVLETGFWEFNDQRSWKEVGVEINIHAFVTESYGEKTQEHGGSNKIHVSKIKTKRKSRGKIKKIIKKNQEDYRYDLLILESKNLEKWLNVAPKTPTAEQSEFRSG